MPWIKSTDRLPMIDSPFYLPIRWVFADRVPYYSTGRFEEGMVKDLISEEADPIAPNIEWLEIDPEPNQDELWGELINDMNEENFPTGHVESLAIYWANKYTISRSLSGK